ncbi:NADH:flavin oxidoreductase [Bradyrhizobium sp. LHD-71]|uniref:NADH:flavin oxidoreductase n=1 Tax=Bradyrhizobium sp. LHD-71 TaxID=3072141 RepID=UPI00280F7C00|nr:NADH:flavin oxidoreductase [Bradyrhizobium sp. LHD-71]MDQ8731634.1 NADH:flavin oxidoreductase [Bradyrhizobium sp. LHD-71]
MLFEPFRIKNVAFANRVLRSSLGGRMAYYDGTVSPAFVHFEKRFADGGVAAIISPTISINQKRMSPLEYPSLHDDRFVKPLRHAVNEIRAGSDCRYIVQLGDTGGHSHTSIKPQIEDRISASSFFDVLYGYHNRSIKMSEEDIEAVVTDFANAARRVAEAGCDGVEITASKGYIIHQFLNPVTNRRTDKYGGSVEKRFQLLQEVVQRVRQEVGDGFLFGIRLSAKDFNWLPINIRIPWPPVIWPPRHYFIGNDLPETTYYAKRLEQLGVDYLHIDSGFGFPNPKGSPGDFPDEGLHIFVNATSYLSGKATARAAVYNLVPRPIRKAVFGFGWRFKPAANADFAAAMRRVVGIPIIANGGFQDRSVIDGALSDGKCDMVAIARPLIANPDLLKQFEKGLERPENPCSFCTLCCSHTAVFPLGCYDERRFESREDMLNQVIALCSPQAPFALTGKRLDNDHAETDL